MEDSGSLFLWKNENIIKDWRERLFTNFVKNHIWNLVGSGRVMAKELKEEKVQELLEKGYDEAEALLENEDKM